MKGYVRLPMKRRFHGTFTFKGGASCDSLLLQHQLPDGSSRLQEPNVRKLASTDSRTERMLSEPTLSKVATKNCSHKGFSQQPDAGTIQGKRRCAPDGYVLHCSGPEVISTILP